MCRYRASQVVWALCHLIIILTRRVELVSVPKVPYEAARGNSLGVLTLVEREELLRIHNAIVAKPVATSLL